MRMRKALVGAAAVLLTGVVVLLGAAGVDFGTSIYAEYRLSRTVRETAHLDFDPFVAIIAFPLIPQAMRHRYQDVEIKASFDAIKGRFGMSIRTDLKSAFCCLVVWAWYLSDSLSGQVTNW